MHNFLLVGGGKGVVSPPPPSHDGRLFPDCHTPCVVRIPYWKVGGEAAVCVTNKFLLLYNFPAVAGKEKKNPLSSRRIESSGERNCGPQDISSFLSLSVFSFDAFVVGLRIGGRGIYCRGGKEDIFTISDLFFFGREVGSRYE